jgi:hypothetical protein
MRTLLQAMQFAAFTFSEYARSGRALIEVAAAAGCTLVFFRPESGLPPTAEYFFSIAGIFALLLCLYSASAIFTLGDRPPTYVLLAHGLRRSAYLLGLYVTVTGVVAGSYGLLCLAIAIVNPVAGLDVRGWILGSIPLLLNVALLAALLTLLTPMVLTSGWRLTALALVAITFSGNLISGPTMATLQEPLPTVLKVLQTILGAPLLPAFTGFALAVSRDYSGIMAAVPFGQIGLTLALLLLALVVFARREIIFSEG